MKLYQYNIETGIYTGELFEDSGNIHCDEGTTTIAPPSYQAGQVPVFDMTLNSWVVLPAGTVRQLLKIKPLLSESD